MVRDRVLHLCLTVKVIDWLFMEITLGWWSSWAILGLRRLQPAAESGSEPLKHQSVPLTWTALFHCFLYFLYCSFWLFSFSYITRKKCQEPPLTPNHSWVTAPIYLIPPCHSTQIMFCAILVIYRNSETVGSSYNTSNCWDSVNSLWFLKKFAGVLSGLVLNVLYYQDSEWLRGETKVQPLLRGSIYPIRHFIKFVRCILVYTQELWQLKMADVSV